MDNSQYTPPDFLNGMISDLKPVQRLPSVGFRVMSWLIPTLLILLGGSYLLGWDKVIEFRFSQISFWLEQVFLLALGLLAAFSAIYSSVPGQEKHTHLILSLVSAGAWVAFLGYLLLSWFFAGAQGEVHHTTLCPSVVVILALPVAILLVHKILNGAVLNGTKTGFYISLSAAAMASFGLQLVCSVGQPLHLVLYHFLPALVISCVGVFSGKYLQSYWERTADKKYAS